MQYEVFGMLRTNMQKLEKSVVCLVYFDKVNLLVLTYAVKN